MEKRKSFGLKKQLLFTLKGSKLYIECNCDFQHMVEGGEKGAVAMLDLVVEVFVFLKQHGYLIGIEIELKMRIASENIYVEIKGCNR